MRGQLRLRRGRFRIRIKRGLRMEEPRLKEVKHKKGYKWRPSVLEKMSKGGKDPLSKKVKKSTKKTSKKKRFSR